MPDLLSLVSAEEADGVKTKTIITNARNPRRPVKCRMTTSFIEAENTSRRRKRELRNRNSSASIESGYTVVFIYENRQQDVLARKVEPILSFFDIYARSDLRKNPRKNKNVTSVAVCNTGCNDCKYMIPKEKSIFMYVCYRNLDLYYIHARTHAHARTLIHTRT